MNVRDLIANLLDYDMDAQVEIRIESKENDDSISDFEIQEEKYTVQKYLNLTVSVRDQVLVNANDYNDLKDAKEELANEVETLQSKLEDAEQQIYELERESD
ncbi:hypothetical protein [Lysinibacillus sp. FSL W8-0992]|uniref:hypothetical protein n=1 Tax=Lysinibacillus sp. FSL W8-0992 TaxID=2954643 RepID=UPI0030F7B8F5